MCIFEIFRGVLLSILKLAAHYIDAVRMKKYVRLDNR